MRTFVLVVKVLTCSELALLAGEGYVPMTVEADGIIMVPAVINGHGPFPFVIDTGSNRTAISADLARTLELPVVAKTEVVGVTGREYRAVARLTASIGTSAPVSLMASVVPPEKLHANARGARGIIGQDMLMTFNYTLDYKRQRFTLSLPEVRNGSSIELPLEVEEGRLVLTLPSKNGQRLMRLVPDSGATSFVVFDWGGQLPFATESMDGAMQVGTMASTQTVPMVRLREVRLNTLTLRDQMAAVIRRSNKTALSIDALLPLKIFQTVAFDMERRRMIVRCGGG
jgi:predicted aspartyl protease